MEIPAFQSIREYKKFVLWVEEQVKNGDCEELLEVEKQSTEWDDRRFRCKSTGQVWKLSCPDPGYFPGSWLAEISPR
jgi:hypothetical protein